MQLASVIKKLHQRSPKLGQAVSLTTATSVIAANSIVCSLPIWFTGGMKMITGAKIADKAVIGITNHWIGVNNNMQQTLG